MMFMASCSYRDIAKVSGYSLTSVSFALRGDPRLPEATRAKIVAVAKSLGYRPNARVAELMESVRRQCPLGELRADLALCWYDVSREAVEQTA